MMPNNMKMKHRNSVTLPSSGKELIRAPTSYLMLGIALMLLSGLITLKILNGLMFNAAWCDPKFELEARRAQNSIIPDAAITKSITFQTSLK
jgi:hypothetical protein